MTLVVECGRKAEQQHLGEISGSRIFYGYGVTQTARADAPYADRLQFRVAVSFTYPTVISTMPRKIAGSAAAPPRIRTQHAAVTKDEAPEFVIELDEWCLHLSLQPPLLRSSWEDYY
jgi:hypothetical protein